MGSPKLEAKALLQPLGATTVQLVNYLTIYTKHIYKNLIN